METKFKGLPVRKFYPEDGATINGSAVEEKFFVYDGPATDKIVSSLYEALEKLLKFTEELCEDVGISKNYPSLQRSKAALSQARGELNNPNNSEQSKTEKNRGMCEKV